MELLKKMWKKKTKHKNSEAPQAGLIASNWQRWVRQLGFSNGSLCHSFFFSPFSCQAVLWLHGSVCLVVHTWTGSVWFICSLMSWMLPRIFFWWPASVTPIRSRSLQEKQIKKKERKENWGQVLSQSESQTNLPLWITTPPPLHPPPIRPQGHTNTHQVGTGTG